MSVITTVLYLILIACSQASSNHICSRGCGLLYNEDLDCISHHAFVPNLYINNDIDRILKSKQYICFNPHESVSNEALTNAQQSATGSIFDMEAYVFLWQAISIAIVVPFLVYVLLQLLWALITKISDVLHCKTKCKCCLSCCSSEYRQQQRNRGFQGDQLRNEDNKSWKWIFAVGRNNNDGNVGNNNNDHNDRPQNNGEGAHDEYQHIPLEDNDNIALPQNVLEEVSVEHNENNMQQYLQPGEGMQGNQDIELSFSSHGLRQISYRDVV